MSARRALALLGTAAFVLIAPRSARDATAAKLEHTLWVGHQFVEGRRVVPILGPLRTRTDTYVIARVRRRGGRIELEQRTCRVDFAKVAGGKVRLSDRGVAALPSARITFRPHQSRLLYAAPWRVGWGSEDIDRDGKPGMTIRVDAPLCGGTLQVASRTTSVARGQRRGELFVGQVAVTVRQRILGASGRCLRLVARDSKDSMIGHFAYRRVPAGTTCSDLARRPWPVRAPRSL
ncbi:MAG: hypothetical protein KC503_35865 [Myxococcales bacterium]|nr:hypothetical protein [Myxococcales bacterium]